MEKKMCNKKVLLECLRFLRLPITTNVLYEVLDALLLVYSADILGQFSDAAINLEWDIGLNKIIILGLCIVASVLLIPALSLLSDFVMHKNSLKHDRVVFSHFLDKEMEIAASLDKGKVQFEFEDAPNELRICTLVIYSNYIILPLGIAYLLYNTLCVSIILTIVLFILACLKLIVPIVVKKKMTYFDQKNREYQGNRYSQEMDTMTNSSFLKSYGIEKRMLERIARLYVDFHSEHESKYLLYQSMLQYFGSFFDIIAKIILLIVGAFLVSHSAMTAGQLVSMMVYLTAAQKILGYGVDILQRKPIWNNALERVSMFYQDEENAIGEVVNDFHTISIEQLSASYDTRQIISNLSFTIYKGDKICLTGENGSGKSTLLRILNTEIKSYQGRIMVDECELRNLNPSFYRKMISYAPQQSFVFSGTVRENIAIGNTNCTDIDIENIVTMFDLKHITDKVITSSSELSGGELQKISLARAILKDSPILILDEPTNHLDLQTVDRLIAYLKKTDKTLILVSHDEKLKKFSKVIESVDFV